MESIRQQTTPDWELILIDDGSTDGSSELMQDFARKDSRIKLVQQAHQGIVSALNAGLEVARGEFVARMDADDFSYPDRLKLQADFLIQHPEIDLVSCMVEYGGDRETQQGYAEYVDGLNRISTSEEIELSRFQESPLAHPSVMFRRECVEKWGAYQKNLEGPEDYELWLRWLDAGAKMSKLPQMLFRWNDLSQRLSRQHADYSDMAFARVRARYLSRWLARHNPAHPQVVIWGAGKQSRRRLQPLLELGIQPRAFIDVKTKADIGGLPVFHFTETAKYQRDFVLSYVNNREAREEIRHWLLKMDKVEGRDFLIC